MNLEQADSKIVSTAISYYQKLNDTRASTRTKVESEYDALGLIAELQILYRVKENIFPSGARQYGMVFKDIIQNYSSTILSGGGIEYRSFTRALDTFEGSITDLPMEIREFWSYHIGAARKLSRKFSGGGLSGAANRLKYSIGRSTKASVKSTMRNYGPSALFGLNKGVVGKLESTQIKESKGKVDALRASIGDVPSGGAGGRGRGGVSGPAIGIFNAIRKNTENIALRISSLEKKLEEMGRVNKKEKKEKKPKTKREGGSDRVVWRTRDGRFASRAEIAAGLATPSRPSGGGGAGGPSVMGAMGRMLMGRLMTPVVGRIVAGGLLAGVALYLAKNLGQTIKEKFNEKPKVDGAKVIPPSNLRPSLNSGVDFGVGDPMERRAMRRQAQPKTQQENKAPTGVVPVVGGLTPKPNRSKPVKGIIGRYAESSGDIIREAKAVGLAPDTLAMLMGAESGMGVNKINPISDARGVGQHTAEGFIDSVRLGGDSPTLAPYVDQANKIYKEWVDARQGKKGAKSKKQIKEENKEFFALRDNDSISLAAAASFNRIGVNNLKRQGIDDPTVGEIYSTYFFGNAKNAAKARKNPNALFTPSALELKQNPDLKKFNQKPISMVMQELSDRATRYEDEWKAGLKMAQESGTQKTPQPTSSVGSTTPNKTEPVFIPPTLTFLQANARNQTGDYKIPGS